MPKDAIDMTRRTIVITGASDGIGAAAARRLSRNGENVVIIGRSQRKTTAIATELGADYFTADFADLTQVRAVADKIRSEYPRIDVLANNAGGMCHDVQLTPTATRRPTRSTTWRLSCSPHYCWTCFSILTLLSSTRPVRRSACFRGCALPIWKIRRNAGPALLTRGPNWRSSCSPWNCIAATTPTDCRPQHFTRDT